MEKAMTNKMNLAKWVKYLLDFLFFGGILVTISVPFSMKWFAVIFDSEGFLEHYESAVIAYFVMGVSAVVILGELRKIFKTVLNQDCFVMGNVSSLSKMGNWSFFIAVMAVVRSIIYLTLAMVVVAIVFLIAGLFSKVLAIVFEEAVRYKEENDLTI